MSEIEILLAGFQAASARRGEFEHFTVRANGMMRVVWHDHAEEFTPEQQRRLVEVYGNSLKPSSPSQPSRDT